MDKVNIKYMKEALVRDMILFICDKYSMTIPDAMNVVYSSETYRMLAEDNDFMFTQSNVYLTDCLDKELKSGKVYG